MSKAFKSVPNIHYKSAPVNDPKDDEESINSAEEEFLNKKVTTKEEIANRNYSDKFSDILADLNSKP